jgi:protein-disulfide isomerase
VESTAQKLGLPYPQVRDRSAALARRFGVRGTPTIVVIEPSGEVSYNGHELPAAWSSK